VAVAIPIIVILVIAVATTIVLAANRQRANTGLLSRETKQRDASIESEAEAGLSTSTSTELETTGRERADDTRATYESTPATRTRGEVTVWEPVDEEELGVSRRQFLNRGLVGVVGFSVAGFGAACLGFLWPTGSSGFGGKINAGKTSDIVDYIQSHAAPFYIPEARAYVAQYPPGDLSAAKKAYSPVTYAGMELGFVALYQRCVHLGCRVPWCQSSQWFECPCHGSKYNRVGEKKAGPAPRGLDRFELTVGGGQMTINTGDIQLGPPIGTNTTGQQQEGPLCV
jgi:cytochrome b6-f complex iron-sulfur subunit